MCIYNFWLACKVGGKREGAGRARTAGRAPLLFLLRLPHQHKSPPSSPPPPSSS